MYKSENVIRCLEGKGIASTICSLLYIYDYVFFIVSLLLEKYIYDFPDEMSINFVNGLRIDGKKDIQKLRDIKTREDILRTIEKGKSLKGIFDEIYFERNDNSELYNINIFGMNLNVIAAIADNFKIVTGLLIAKKSNSGIAFIFTYDLDIKATLFKIIVLKEAYENNNNLHAGKIAKKISNGKGCASNGYGIISDLVWPHDFFKKLSD